MTSYRFCILLALFGAIIELQSCVPNECSDANLEGCRAVQWPNKCPNFPKIVTCLKTLDTCKDGMLELRRTFLLELYTEEIMNSSCPGLPEGKCISSEMKFCAKDIPMNVKPIDDLLWKPICVAHDGKTAGMKKCFADLERKCPPKKEFIHGDINWLTYLETYCKEMYGMDINPENSNTDE